MRRLASWLLGLLICFDALFAFNLWKHGPPTILRSWSEDQNGLTLDIVRAPMSRVDWAELAVVVILHTILIAFLWRTRPSAVATK